MIQRNTNDSQNSRCDKSGHERSRIAGLSLSVRERPSTPEIVVELFEAPEGTGCAGGSLDELFAVLDLRVENRRERGFLGPLGGRGLHLDRLLCDFLAGVDVPGGELLRALDAQQVAAKSFEHGTVLFVR